MLRDSALGIIDADSKFKALLTLSSFYQVFSAIALLTIWLRVVELLARTPPRVKLLEATLMRALGAMAIYFAYISTFLIGFWAFAHIHFASFSQDYIGEFEALISIFQLLCLNIAAVKSVKNAPLRGYFIGLFMIFAVISVQMYNSIINYAYNRVSEDMEPVFKRAAREKKHKEEINKRSVSAFKNSVASACAFCKKRVGLKKAEPERTETVIYEKEKKKADEVAPADLQPADKEKLDEFTESLQKKPASESGCAFAMYFLFASSYLCFLLFNLDIGRNGRITTTVGEALHSVVFEEPSPRGNLGFHSLSDVDNINSLRNWMTQALPKFVFDESADQSSAGFFAQTTGTYEQYACIQNWNCFISGTHAGSVPKIIRVTQRLQRRIPNLGVIPMDPASDYTPRFMLGSVVSPIRGPKNPIYAEGDNGDNEDTTTDLRLSFAGADFCKRDDQASFRKGGGIVCLLDADRYNMTNQLGIMGTNGYYSMATGTIIVEMVLRNNNINSVVSVILAFTLKPSGRVTVKDYVRSFSLLKVHRAKSTDGVGDNLLDASSNFRIEYIVGVIYTVLVVFFLYRMFLEIQMEAYRKKLNEGTPFLLSFGQFFLKDFFHILDLISYLLSLGSIIFFLVWILEQLDIVDRVDGDFVEFITYIASLNGNSRTYTVISSCNALFIFVRPLKYLRGDPRMAKINLTFYHSIRDIFWFIVMLLFFFTGFVFFSHLLFGSELEKYASLGDTAVSCFTFLLGEFDFWIFWKTRDWAALVFVFGFLFLFKFFFLNVFFAIIDKNFVSGDPPPLNLKRTLKPALSRLVRWIQWDDDYNMQKPDEVEKERPVSRSGRVHQFAKEIEQILNGDIIDAHGETVFRHSKSLGDVCDSDEKLNEVLRWSRDEAKRFVESYRRLQVQKAEFRNDDVFFKSTVQVQIEKELKANEEAMLEAERHQRYAILVNEAMERRDQETLSKYILRLEGKIQKKMIEKHALLTDVYHLRAESDKMQYSDDDVRQMAEGENLLQDAQEAEDGEHGEQDHADGESSDGEYAQPPPAALPGQASRPENGNKPFALAI
jgi:hypothetical protein